MVGRGARPSPMRRAPAWMVPLAGLVWMVPLAGLACFAIANLFLLTNTAVFFSPCCSSSSSTRLLARQQAAHTTTHRPSDMLLPYHKTALRRKHRSELDSTIGPASLAPPQRPAADTEAAIAIQSAVRGHFARRILLVHVAFLDFLSAANHAALTIQAAARRGNGMTVTHRSLASPSSDSSFVQGMWLDYQLRWARVARQAEQQAQTERLHIEVLIRTEARLRHAQAVIRGRIVRKHLALLRDRLDPRGTIRSMAALFRLETFHVFGGSLGIGSFDVMSYHPPEDGHAGAGLDLDDLYVRQHRARSFATKSSNAKQNRARARAMAKHLSPPSRLSRVDTGFSIFTILGVLIKVDDILGNQMLSMAATEGLELKHGMWGYLPASAARGCPPPFFDISSLARLITRTRQTSE